MKWTAQDIKSALATALEKKGSSLEQFESQLRQHPDSIEKTALDPVSIAKALFNSAGAVTLGAGALGGAGLYGAYQMSQNSDDKILKKLKEKQQYEEATRSLQAALANSQMPA